MPLQKYHDKLTDLQTDGAAGNFYNFARKIAQKLYDNKQSIIDNELDELITTAIATNANLDFKFNDIFNINFADVFDYLSDDIPVWLNEYTKDDWKRQVTIEFIKVIKDKLIALDYPIVDDNTVSKTEIKIAFNSTFDTNIFTPFIHESYNKIDPSIKWYLKKLLNISTNKEASLCRKEQLVLMTKLLASFIATTLVSTLLIQIKLTTSQSTANAKISMPCSLPSWWIVSLTIHIS